MKKSKQPSVYDHWSLRLSRFIWSRPLSIASVVLLAGLPLHNVLASDHERYMTQAHSALQRGDFDRAESAFMRASLQSPSLQALEAKEQLIHLYFSSRRYAQGLAYVAEFLADHPNSARLHSLQAMLLNQVDHHTQAEAAHEQAVKLAPKDLSILQEAAGFYQQHNNRGRLDTLVKTIDELNAAKKADPKQSKAEPGKVNQTNAATGSPGSPPASHVQVPLRPPQRPEIRP